ncbi:MAG TPA: prepilin-type N-terminal cleavage/methylation domain-containing protein [Candidatus Polarisedimenticolia bacterium]|jgi:prepilin-type N-terminal cleavage/methylation domain-containing protein|nr:prepilin-type N-terminal cleavage/methylation domain-containing protein [Candidatus Polarisedimenticolia bacterium]
MTTERTQERRRRTEQGYSLPELLTVIALMGIFILFGGPAMADAFKAYKVKAGADIVATDVRGMRYAAVGQRATFTMTTSTQGSGTNPNTYVFTNAMGNTITRRLEQGVNLENGSAATLSFNSTGATGSTATQVLIVSMDINDTRGDRYTISVSPTGTVTTAYATYTP